MLHRKVGWLAARVLARWGAVAKPELYCHKSVGATGQLEYPGNQLMSKVKHFEIFHPKIKAAEWPQVAAFAHHLLISQKAVAGSIPVPNAEQIAGCGSARSRDKQWPRG